MRADLFRRFENLYGKKASLAYFSPGRVNLIGEHIDYNGGLVLPCAISFGTYLLISPNNNNKFRFKSLDFKESPEISLQDRYVKDGNNWYNYPLGVINEFLKAGKHVSGLDMLFYGDIPIGSGLSSSASIEIVTAFAFNQIFKNGFTKLDLVKLSKSVENNFIGVNTGIMDQFAVAFGEKNKALMLNCDTLAYQAVDTNLGDYTLAIINTNKARKLSESKYNERVEQCQTALTALQQELKITHLCDIDSDTFKAYSHLINDDTVLKRATHVIEENDRVKLAAQALGNGDLQEFGRLMYASHKSLRDLYEVSGKELDTIVDYSSTNPDVAGARMTGAGFGGCAIAIVKKNGFQDYSKQLTAYYQDKIGYEPSVYDSEIGDGVGAWDHQ